MAIMQRLGQLQSKGKMISSVGTGNPASILASAAENRPESGAGQLMALGSMLAGYGAFGGGGGGGAMASAAPGGAASPKAPSLGVNTDLGYGPPDMSAFQRRMSRFSQKGMG